MFLRHFAKVIVGRVLLVRGTNQSPYDAPQRLCHPHRRMVCWKMHREPIPINMYRLLIPTPRLPVEARPLRMHPSVRRKQAQGVPDGLHEVNSSSLRNG